MSYPVGPLLRTLAERILKNLDLIDRQAPKWGVADQDEPPYTDTQLLVSLLGVLVFPNKRNGLSSPPTNLNSCGAISRRWATRTR